MRRFGNLSSDLADVNQRVHLYCINNLECQTAEATLKDGGVGYIKREIRTEDNKPVLVSPNFTCRGNDAIRSFVIATEALRKFYSIEI